MIPKKIHYCWFSGNKMPKEFEAYIASWKKNCPDYEIIRWDETNYDVSRNTYMKDAYKEKRWGFVPDYARFDIIYQEGGIYLDTDVELLKSLDPLLDNPCFLGFEDKNHIINCDKSLLLRAIVNLIDNAAQHSEDGGKITMTVSIIKDTMYLVVDDFGCGFSEEALKSAKDQFFTEKSSRSGKHYGLGIYIADTVVENHGGKLQYINKEREKGARVWIEMPVLHC